MRKSQMKEITKTIVSHVCWGNLRQSSIITVSDFISNKVTESLYWLDDSCVTELSYSRTANVVKFRRFAKDCLFLRRHEDQSVQQGVIKHKFVYRVARLRLTLNGYRIDAD